MRRLVLRTLIISIAVMPLVSCCKDSELPGAFKDLYSSSAKDRNEAALTLASCGSPKADRAVSRLIQLLNDENVGVQSSAAYALRRIGTKQASEALERASKHRD